MTTILLLKNIRMDLIVDSKKRISNATLTVECYLDITNNRNHLVNYIVDLFDENSIDHFKLKTNDYQAAMNCYDQMLEKWKFN